MWTVAAKVVCSLSTRAPIEVAIGNKATIRDFASSDCVPPSAITRAASAVIPAWPLGSSTAPLVKRSATVTIGFWLGGSAIPLTSPGAPAGVSAAVRTSAGDPGGGCSIPSSTFDRGLAVSSEERPAGAIFTPSSA